MPARNRDAAHLEVGRKGEDAAAAHLQAKGLIVLARNLVLGRLELDLLCRDGDTLVFVEVKTRAEGSLASPAEGLTAQKRQRLLRAAQAYLSQQNLWGAPCRFDLVSVRLRGGAVAALEHVEDVIDAADAGSAPKGSWQPW